MQVNENVYGAADTWIESNFLSSGTMKTKCPNFNGGNTLESSTLGAGNTANKTPHNQLIDRSISFSALGTESLYSHLVYVNGSPDNITVDNVPATEFFFCESRVMYNRRNVEENRNYISLNYPYNMWKEYATDPDNYYHNYSDKTIPYTELNPKKILYVLQVYPCKADGTEYGQWVFFGTYDRNASNIRTNYPYIMGARLNPRIDNTTTETPNRAALTDPDALFGIAINREFSALQNDDIKINYAISRCMIIDNILIYGNDGKEIYGENRYNIFMANENDIQFDTENGLVYAMMEYNRDFILQQAACFGVYFRISDQGSAAGSITTLPLDSAGVCLGLLDENGIGHGDYTQGAENRNNPIWNWNSYSQSTYDWTKPVDPTPYNDRTVFGSNSLSNTFIQYYAMNRTMLNILCSQIYNYINSVDTNVEDIYKAVVKEFYTNNPLDVIVSLKMFPFDIDNYIAGDVRLVKLGHLQTTAAGKKLNGSYNVVDLGSYQCFPKFGNTFLDYSPFTYYELIVPFCGTIRLDPAQFMDKTLRLKMAIDLYTGACTCYILADNLCIDSISGNCAVDMAITGIQSADFQNSIQNAITNVKNARLSQMNWNARGNLAMGAIWRGNLGVNVGSGHETSKFAGLGNVLADLGGSLNPLSFGSTVLGSQQREAELFMNVNKAEYDLQHITTPFASVGSQSAANCRMEEMKARLIIYRPKIAPDFNPQIYADSYGYATLENDVLSKYSGFTVAKINTEGLRCSEEERQMIENMFSNGVYL